MVKEEMHSQEIFNLTLTQGQSHMKNIAFYILLTYVTAKLEVAAING